MIGKKIRINITDKEWRAINNLIDAEIDSIYSCLNPGELYARRNLKDHSYYPDILIWRRFFKKYNKLKGSK